MMIKFTNRDILQMKKILLIMAFLSTLFGAKAQELTNINILTVSEFNQQTLNNDVQLIDVRTEKEFNEGAIEGARNMDFLQQESFIKQIEKLDINRPIYLYCRSGNRSHQAAEQLKNMGFETVYDLEGGYSLWSAKK